MIGPVERTPVTACPGCGHRSDSRAQAALAESDVSEGDAAVCLYCSTVAVYGPDMTLRLPTPAEAESLTADPGVREAVDMLRRWKLHQAFRGMV